MDWLVAMSSVVDVRKQVIYAHLMEPWADRIFGTTPEELHKLKDKDAMLLDINSKLHPDWGSFTTFDMQQAFHMMGTSTAQRYCKLLDSCQERNLSMSELTGLYMLRVRIMLSHRRQRMANRKQPKDPPPKKLGVNLEADAEAFQKYALMVYPPIPVRRYFNGNTFEAMELLSDGEEKKADLYIQGPQGCAVAKFKDHQMKLEVPNTCVSPDGQLVQHKSKGQAKTAAISKKPAAASTDGQDGINEKEAEGDK